MVVSSVAVVFLVRGVIAGAARAVAGNERTLGELWFAWGVRAALVVALCMFVLGLVELMGARHRLWRALFLDRRRHRELAGRT
jgi:hypothetical protein